MITLDCGCQFEQDDEGRIIFGTHNKNEYGLS